MKKVLAVVLIILIGGVVVSNFAMATTTGKVTAETVRLRREANTSSDVMELIDENEEVEILDEDDGWYKVAYNGLTGYVSAKYIEEIGSSSSNSSNSSNATTSSNSTNSSNTVASNTADSTSDGEENTSNSVYNNVSNVENNATSNTASNEVTNTISNSVNNSVAISNAVSTSDSTSEKASEYTLSSEVELRKVPSLMAGKSSTISSGTQVTVTYRLNKWVKISDGTNTGWVLEQSL